MSSGQLFHYMDNNRDNQVSLVEFKYGLSLAGVRVLCTQLSRLHLTDAESLKEFARHLQRFTGTLTSPSPSKKRSSPAKFQVHVGQTLNDQAESPETLSRTRDLRRLMILPRS